jgi:fatty acid CoA ligase FadD21
MPKPSVLSVLRELASLQPNDTALPYTDYNEDWAGVAESVTWPRLYQRTPNVAWVQRFGLDQFARMDA